MIFAGTLPLKSICKLFLAGSYKNAQDEIKHCQTFRKTDKSNDLDIKDIAKSDETGKRKAFINFAFCGKYTKKGYLVSVNRLLLISLALQSRLIWNADMQY